MMAIIITLVLLVAIVVFFVKIYNQLVRLKNQVANGLAQIDVQLKRRYDLIPNLIETAKHYMAHENATLVAVIDARNHAKSVNQQPHSIDDTQTLQALAQAEQTLSKALGQFYAVMENYPELKADKLMTQVMDELTNTENRIGFARQHYNDSVMFYNNEREVFPNTLISGFFRFEPLTPLQFQDQSAIAVAPKVSFG